MPIKDDTAAPLQTFSDAADPSKVSTRVAALRAQMAEQNFDAFLVPRADAHRGESVPACDARLAWLSGFTGSAGLAIVASQKAVLLVDGRYTLQAPAQTDTNIFEIAEIPAATSANWLLENVAPNARIAYDPWLHTKAEVKALANSLSAHAKLVPTLNIIDKIWHDRPQAPQSDISFLDLERAGITATEKCANLQKRLIDQGANTLILTMPESLCWLFNMRGHDVPNTPFVLGFAIVPSTGSAQIFVSEDKLTPAARTALEPVATLHEKSQFTQQLQKISADQTVWLDPSTAPSAVADILQASGAQLLEKPDPIMALKARKNAREIEGMRDAQHRDGIAMANFLHWFDQNAASGSLSEIAIVRQLEAFRRADSTLVDISFDTISGAGPNGAIVHYRVTEKTNRTLNPGDLMLVDSGGQYLSGTTDITRTLFTGAATAEQKDRYTRVLKGMIAISRAQFPTGTSGAQLDTLARQALWDVGLNYAHGTGHGVGAFLGVHEGPIGISARYILPLETGHIISNEPGYYKTDAYGIRIENLVLVMQSPKAEGFNAFETLTLAPIDTRLMDKSLLNTAEIDWLNAYHARVNREIGPALAPDVRAWLEDATKPL